jgi:Family of unknown function (DUF5723)
VKPTISFFFTVALTVLCSIGNGQVRHDFSINYPDARHQIGMGSDYLMASDAVTVEFQNAYLNNEFIDTDVKDGSLENMDDRAVMASSLSAGLWFKKRKKDTENNHWFAALRHRSHYNTNFTSDLFGLYFYGNKPYAGETADLSDLNYRSMSWQQAQFGMNWRFQKDSSYWEITGAVSLLNGQQYMDFTTGRGTFYTDPDAEYIEMDLELKSQQSDSADYSFGASNGFGASVDLMATYSHNKSYYVTFGIRDAGAIAWNNSSFTYTVDTLYRFEGAVVDNFFDSLFLDISTEEDFVNGFIESRESGGFTTMLPMWVGAEYGKILLEGQLTVFGGFDYLIESDYTPHFKVGGEYIFNKSIVAGAAFHTGGYSNFGWELYGGFDLTGGLILTAGTNYLGGFVAPGSATAQGAHFGLMKVF